MLPAKLDYLFVCRFKDATIYRQTSEDRSVLHPLSRSAFWDIQQRLWEVERFILTDRHHQHEHTVFLDDGHFKTDGTIIVCPRPGLVNFRLIYCRHVQQRLESGFHSRAYVVGYVLGWQANDPADGKNYQMRLEIPPPGSLQRVQVERKF